MKTIPNLIALGTFVSAFALQPSAFSQGSSFTYQGRLNDNASPANGTYDLRFTIYDAAGGGSQVGGILTNAATSVISGLFTVALDFGPGIFTAGSRWLEIATRTNGAGAFTTLTPRQQFTPAPYAILANAASNLSGTVSAAQLTGPIANGNLPANPTFSGTVTAAGFSGNGAGLLGLNASQLTSGNVPDARLSANIARTNQVWVIGGNAGTLNDFIGTTDDTTFNIRVNNVRVMRYRLATDSQGFYTNAPNVIGGSSINSALTMVVGATIAGGGGNGSDGTAHPNQVTADFGTVAGGLDNSANGENATVTGGSGNTASGDDATVGGGDGNTASAASATVSGGLQNTGSGVFATVGGGYNDTASNTSATVAGGNNNTARGAFATVGGGELNTASGDAATVPGGRVNTASGDYSFAAGNRAKADDQGSFVWADSSNFDFHSTAVNQFRVRAIGGAAFITAIDGSGAATAGVRLQAGDTAWSAISDRNQKKNFANVDEQAVLEKLAKIPLQSWNYKWEADTNTPHLGPMAQDFKAAFYPGRDDKSISTLEFDGVELAAIQGLNQKLETENAELRKQLNRHSEENAQLKQRLDRLERLLLKRESE
jgi:hypothetical protein